MADIIDDADKLIEKQRELAIAAAAQKARNMPEGKQGDCDLCGEWSGRLIHGACAPCRDKYDLD